MLCAVLMKLMLVIELPRNHVSAAWSWWPSLLGCKKKEESPRTWYKSRHRQKDNAGKARQENKLANWRYCHNVFFIVTASCVFFCPFLFPYFCIRSPLLAGVCSCACACYWVLSYLSAVQLPFIKFMLCKCLWNSLIIFFQNDNKKNLIGCAFATWIE